MKTLAWIIDTSFSARLTISLLHFVWQGCCGGILVVASERLATGASARFRYLFNVGVLLLMAACLPTTFSLIKTPAMTLDITAMPPNLSTEAAVTSSLPKSRPSYAGKLNPAHVTQNEIHDSSQEAITTAPPLNRPLNVVQFQSSTNPTSLFQFVSQWITFLYLSGIVLILGRLTRGLFGGFRLRQASSLIDDEVLIQTAKRLAVRLGLKVVPTIALCEQITVPVVVGVVKPMILLPIAIMSGLTPSQLEALLLHELAHIRRFDPIVNLAQRIIEAILFFHPAVWFVSRRISVEREFATDDIVLTAGCERPIYADALVRVAEFSSAINGSRVPIRATALSASGTTATEFKLRVMRILNVSPSPKLLLSRSTVLITSLAIILGGICAVWLTARHETTSPLDEAVREIASAQAGASDDQKTANDASSDATKKPSQIPNDPVKTEWGEAKNGLRARVIPVMSSMDEDAIDPTQHVTRFANADDVAFVVELENVGDKPMTLLNNRRQEKTNSSDWLAQFLFSIDVFDQDGKSIERPEVQVVDIDILLDRASVISLKPGEKHSYLLRPAKWYSSLKYRFEPGRYRTVVHYHGMPTETLNRSDGYKRPIPGQLLAATVGDIASSQVHIEVLPPKELVNQSNASPQNATEGDTKQRTLTWGQPTRGLRAAMEFIPWKAAYLHGETPKVKVHVQNVGETPFALLFTLNNAITSATVNDDAGNPVNLGTYGDHDGYDIYAQTTLKPGQILIIDEGSVGFESSKGREQKLGYWPFKLILPAGEYSIKLPEGFYDTEALPLKDREGHAVVLSNVWTGGIQTGETPFTITPRPKDEVVETVPEEGLEFLKPYPKLHDLSLDMTEQQFLTTAKSQKLKWREALDESGNRYEIATDDNAAIIVTFDEDGECTGIAPVHRPAPEKETQPDRIITSAAYTLPDHLNVKAVGFDRGRNQLVSVAIENNVTIRHWDLESRKLKSEATLESKEPGNLFLDRQLMLSGDCKYVIAVLAEGVGIWETATGKFVRLLSLPKELSNDFICSLSCTADSSLIAAGSKSGVAGISQGDAYATLWDVASGRALRVLKHKDAIQICSVALSTDGKWLATGDMKGGAHIWEVKSGNEVISMSGGQAKFHPDPDVSPTSSRQVLCCQFSPDGKYLAISDMLSIKLVPHRLNSGA